MFFNVLCANCRSLLLNKNNCESLYTHKSTDPASSEKYLKVDKMFGVFLCLDSIDLQCHTRYHHSHVFKLKSVSFN